MIGERQCLAAIYSLQMWTGAKPTSLPVEVFFRASAIPTYLYSASCPRRVCLRRMAIRLLLVGTAPRQGAAALDQHRRNMEVSRDLGGRLMIVEAPQMTCDVS